MAGVAVLAGAGMVAVVILHANGVAVSIFFEMTGSGSSSELGGTPSHLTQKCLTNVAQEVRIIGELLSSSSYQYSASRSALQLR
jgi:hypothetical protein